MPAEFKVDDKVKFIKEYRYGDAVCKIGLTGKIVYSASSTSRGDNQTVAVKRDDDGKTVRVIPVAYIEHV